MKEALKFLKDCGTFYVATCEGDQPRVRPFGAICGFEDKLYIVTNNQKAVYKQMLENPKIEISGMSGDRWIRIEGEVEVDDRREARVAMLEANKPVLPSMYSADDNLMVVLRFTHAAATIYSFEGEPKVYNF